MSIVDTIETIGTTIKTDLAAAWADVEEVTDDVLLVCWNGIKPALTQLAPALLADAVTLTQNAVAESVTGATVDQVLTHVYNAAEADGKAEIQTIETNLMSAIASIHVSAAIAAQPAADPMATEAPAPAA